MFFIPKEMVLDHKANNVAVAKSAAETPAITDPAASSATGAPGIDEEAGEGGPGESEPPSGQDEAPEQAPGPGELYAKEVYEGMVYMEETEEIKIRKERELDAFTFLQWGHFVTFLT